MQDLLTAFITYANTHGLSYNQLANSLVSNASADDKYDAGSYELSPALNRAIRYQTSDRRLDTLASNLTETGFRAIPGVGTKTLEEVLMLFKKLHLEFRKPPDNVTVDTPLAELGLSESWIKTMAKNGITTLGGALDHPRMSPPVKKLLKQFLD